MIIGITKSLNRLWQLLAILITLLLKFSLTILRLELLQIPSTRFVIISKISWKQDSHRWVEHCKKKTFS